MKITFTPKTYTLWTDASMPKRRREGGTLSVDGRVVALCCSVRSPDGNVRMRTSTSLPGPFPESQDGNHLAAIAAWLARHPEALAPKGKPADRRDPLTLGRIIRNKWKYSRNRPALMSEAKASRGRLSLPDPQWV